jgi:hypothetical protein
VTVAEVVDREAGWVEDNHRFLIAALASLVGRLTGAAPTGERPDELRERMPAPPALDAVADGFGLSGFERDVLLLCAGVELDGAVAQACATAHGDPARAHATFGLAMSALADPHWSALSPAAPLRRWHLVELAHPHLTTASALRIDERVLHALTGISYLDPRIGELAEPLPPSATPSPPLRAAAGRLTALWTRPDTRCVLVHGRERADLHAVATDASAALGLQAVILRAADLPTAPVDCDLLVRLCERETVLGGRSWVIDVDDAGAEQGRGAVGMGRRIQAPVALVSRSVVEGGAELPAVEVPPVNVGELRAVWRDAVGAGLDGWVDRLAGQFALASTVVAAVTAEASAAGGVTGSTASRNGSTPGRAGTTWCSRPSRPACCGRWPRMCATG